jgi:hypothetical protein
MGDIATNTYVQNIKHCLNTQLMQFTEGKTENYIKNISKYYLSKYEFINIDANAEYIIPIIVTNKSLEEAEQWKVRLTQKFGNIDNINIRILSSKEDADFSRVNDLIHEIATCDIKDIPNIIVMVCHSSRILRDAPQILKHFSRSKRFKEPIKFSFGFDEADKNITTICKFLKLLNSGNYKNQQGEHLVVDIQYITATPLDKFWKKLFKVGIHELINIDNLIDLTPEARENPENYYTSLQAKYMWIDKHDKIYYENDSNPVEYVKNVIKEQKIDNTTRNIIFAPAENKKISHEEMCELFLDLNYTVLMHNGDFKGFIDPISKDRTSIKTFRTLHNIDGELRDVLRKWNQLNSTKSLAITGYFTIERGITFNTDGFNFTHMILSNYHAKVMNSLLQICGRSHGHKDFVDRIKVIMPEEVWKQAKYLIENLFKINSQRPIKYNSTDFASNPANIPVKLEMVDDTYTLELLELVKEYSELPGAGVKKQNMKKEITKKIVEGIHENKCNIYDPNNVFKLNIGQIELTDNTPIRHLKTSRVWVGGNQSDRRFKQFSERFESKTASSQKSGIDEYCIDFAYNDYTYEGFTNPRNIAWITYRK